MSLFPAYSASDEKKQEIVNDKIEPNSSEWIDNDSYQQSRVSVLSKVALENISSPSETTEYSCSGSLSAKNSDEPKQTSAECEQPKINKKIKKNEKKKREVFLEDLKGNNNYLTIKTLDVDMRPLYKTRFLGSWNTHREKINHYKRLKFKRYYKKKMNTIEMDITPINLDRRKEFEEKIRIDDTNIKVWLDYAHFQDEISRVSEYKLLPLHKKLKILDKGLKANPTSIDLLLLKLQTMSKIKPVDEYCQELESMLKKDIDNIILWKALITAVKTSGVLCKKSKVLALYSKCFSTMKISSRKNIESNERKVLALLYDCLTFLRQAGYWEQTWEIIKLNLCMNLDIKKEFFKNDTLEEKTLMDMEELIITSGLPLNLLWLRVETLRERCFWTSINLDEEDGSLIVDEKRLVCYEEVSDFIYPVVSRKSHFQLIVLSLLCLKIPLLPTRHCMLKDFYIEDYIHSVDSLEFILPIIQPAVWVGEQDNHPCNNLIMTDLLRGELTSGPQFLKYHPTRELYLNFIRSVFHTVAEKLPSKKRVSILVWWLRLERLIVFVNKCDPMRESPKKNELKPLIKAFLKKTENRNNLYFYKEYALIEFELGFHDNCMKMMQTLSQMQNINSLSEDEMKSLFSFYRTYFELLFKINNYQMLKSDSFAQVLENFKNFCSVQFKYNADMSIEEMLYNQILKFIMEPIQNKDEEEYFLSSIECDIFICYSYIMLIKNNEFENFNNILELCNRCIEHYSQNLNMKERFHECKIICIQLYQLIKNKKDFDAILYESINQAIDQFPGNTYFRSVKIVVDIFEPCWKLKSLNCESNTLDLLVRVLDMRNRIVHLKKEGLEDSVQLITNKMLAFYKNLSMDEETRICPLIWKLYMLSIREYNLVTKKGEEVYHLSVMQCPWIKSLYLNAAEIAPQVLTEIQDLIEEKELRMHISSQELNILRE
ncbi:protein NRDE2 homolog [Trichogramma pretiosum]|uniref:protein NRDE2 homolog n=1 Tax=Trichogramma pretiosum TaxID=7493 RepID=UPI0006C96612|nr:protein NRDE2 homolog [Trichogramma pretiosum]